MSELKSILVGNDYKNVAIASGNLGNNPSVVEIQAVLTENGIPLPSTKDVTYFLVDTNEHNLQVTYIAELTSYFYTSMVLAK